MVCVFVVVLLFFNFQNPTKPKSDSDSHYNLEQKFSCDFQPTVSQARALKCRLTCNKVGIYVMETQGNSEHSFQGQWNFQNSAPFINIKHFQSSKEKKRKKKNPLKMKAKTFCQPNHRLRIGFLTRILWYLKNLTNESLRPLVTEILLQQSL